jgi:hypothetical protein
MLYFSSLWQSSIVRCSINLSWVTFEVRKSPRWINMSQNNVTVLQNLLLQSKYSKTQLKTDALQNGFLYCGNRILWYLCISMKQNVRSVNINYFTYEIYIYIYLTKFPWWFESRKFFKWGPFNPNWNEMFSVISNVMYFNVLMHFR